MGCAGVDYSAAELICVNNDKKKRILQNEVV